MPRRRYSHEDIATALAAYKAADGNVAEAARATGIPAANIRRWVKNPEREAANMVPEKELDLRAALLEVAGRLVGAIPDKIAEAPLNHTAVALGIVFDKLQLLEGKPTSIDEVRDGDGRRELDEVLDRLAARHAAPPRETSGPN